MNAIGELGRFDLVGVMELRLFGIQYLVGQIGTYYGHLAPGVKPMNTSHKYVTYDTLPHHLQIELHERNQIDLKFYEYAVKLVYDKAKAKAKR